MALANSGSLTLRMAGSGEGAAVEVDAIGSAGAGSSPELHPLANMARIAMADLIPAPSPQRGQRGA